MGGVTVAAACGGDGPGGATGAAGDPGGTGTHVDAGGNPSEAGSAADGSDPDEPEGACLDIPSEFDVNDWLMDPTPGGSDSSSEPSGNFRMFCQFSHLNYDDPIVFPKQKDKAHLHMWFGHTEGDYSSTCNSLRKSGKSTCDGGPLNRTAYWMPAVFDASGNVVIPTRFELYYKVENTPDGSLQEKQDHIQTVKPYPAGLRMISGYPYNTRFGWKCDGGPGSTTIPNCAGSVRLTAFIRFPYCWDGVNLTTPDQSHMAFGENNSWGACPPTHPVHLPELTEFAHFYLENPAEDTSAWYMASDRMKPAPSDWQPNGSTLHADWFGGWDPTIQKRWVEGCLHGMKSVSNGNLCDGKQLWQSSNEAYAGPKRLPSYPPMAPGHH
jgi:hypothetical protein